MARITFYGAARQVTGSCYLLTVGHRKILIECGLLQGSREDEKENRSPEKGPFTSCSYIRLASLRSSFSDSSTRG